MNSTLTQPVYLAGTYSIKPAPALKLPPVPPADERYFAFEPFAAPGLETVDVLRPRDEAYRTTDPDAPALVLVPGLGMDCRGYIKQLPLGAIADLHMPQAMSEGIMRRRGLGHFARHVEEYVLRRGLDRRPGGFVIGGSSMGGSVSLHLCLRGRVKPRALLMLGSFANAAHLPLYQRVLAPFSRHLPIDRMRRLARRIAGHFDTLAGFKSEELCWLISEGLRRTRDYYGRAIMALTRQNQILEARGLKLPTLVVHGTQDWVLPHAAGEEIAATIPGARFVSVKGAGHGVFFTHAEQVNAEIAAFLRRL